jgi:cytochrome c556
MSKLTRAVWRGADKALQNAYQKAEDAGDTKAADAVYQRMVDHAANRSRADAVAEGAREIRGSWRYVHGKPRFTDDLQ